MKNIADFGVFVDLGGVDGLLQRPQQLRSDKAANVFDNTYEPVTGDDLLVSTDYPVTNPDFGTG